MCKGASKELAAVGAKPGDEASASKLCAAGIEATAIRAIVHLQQAGGRARAVDGRKAVGQGSAVSRELGCECEGPV